MIVLSGVAPGDSWRDITLKLTLTHNDIFLRWPTFARGGEGSLYASGTPMLMLTDIIRQDCMQILFGRKKVFQCIGCTAT